jgi:hypothetical protein
VKGVAAVKPITLQAGDSGQQGGVGFGLDLGQDPETLTDNFYGSHFPAFTTEAGKTIDKTALSSFKPSGWRRSFVLYERDWNRRLWRLGHCVFGVKTVFDPL